MYSNKWLYEQVKDINDVTLLQIYMTWKHKTSIRIAFIEYKFNAQKTKEGNQAFNSQNSHEYNLKDKQIDDQRFK